MTAGQMQSEILSRLKTYSRSNNHGASARAFEEIHDANTDDDYDRDGEGGDDGDKKTHEVEEGDEENGGGDGNDANSDDDYDRDGEGGDDGDEKTHEVEEGDEENGGGDGNSGETFGPLGTWDGYCGGNSHHIAKHLSMSRNKVSLPTDMKPITSTTNVTASLKSVRPVSGARVGCPVVVLDYRTILSIFSQVRNDNEDRDATDETTRQRLHKLNFVANRGRSSRAEMATRCSGKSIVVKYRQCCEKLFKLCLRGFEVVLLFTSDLYDGTVGDFNAFQLKECIADDWGVEVCMAGELTTGEWLSSAYQDKWVKRDVVYVSREGILVPDCCAGIRTTHVSPYNYYEGNAFRYDESAWAGLAMFHPVVQHIRSGGAAVVDDVVPIASVDQMLPVQLFEPEEFSPRAACSITPSDWHRPSRKRKNGGAPPLPATVTVCAVQPATSSNVCTRSETGQHNPVLMHDTTTHCSHCGLELEGVETQNEVNVHERVQEVPLTWKQKHDNAADDKLITTTVDRCCNATSDKRCPSRLMCVYGLYQKTKSEISSKCTVEMVAEFAVRKHMVDSRVTLAEIILEKREDVAGILASLARISSSRTDSDGVYALVRTCVLLAAQKSDCVGKDAALKKDLAAILVGRPEAS
jgi:hypothetical protein